jgi:hypothetical protein
VQIFYSSGNNTPVLGLAVQTTRSSGTSNDETYQIHGYGKLLTQARPNSTSLRIESSKRQSLGNAGTPAFSPTVPDGDIQFVMCLKFKHHNQLIQNSVKPRRPV